MAEPDMINKDDASEKGQRKNKLYSELNSSWYVRQEQEQFPQMMSFYPCMVLTGKLKDADE